MQKDWDKTPERQRKSDAKAGHQASYRRQNRWRARAKPSPPTYSSTTKSPSAGRQSTAHKLPQYCYARHRRQPRAHAPAARNHTGRQRQGHTGANRAYRRNAANRNARTTRDRTPSDRERTAEATRQKTPRQSTNEPARPRAKPTDARWDTRHKEGTRHDRTKNRDARRTG